MILDFSCTPPFLVWVLGCVASCLRPVRFPPPSGGVCLPPSFFFWLGEGGVVLGPILSWLCGARRCLSRSWASWSPPPFPFRLGCVYYFLLVVRRFSGGVCAGVSGVSFPSVGRCSRLGIAWFGWVVPQCCFRGPVGVAFGVAWLGGLRDSCGVAVRPLGFVSVPCPPPPCFSSGCALVVGRGFPPCCAVCLSLFFCFGGDLPVPPSAFPGLVHALVGMWFC